MKISKTINNSNKGYDFLYNYMIKLDKLYKIKYKDDVNDIQQYFTILKDKPNKTKYAYSIKMYNDSDLPYIINFYYSLKYVNSQYDIICFVANEHYYETDYLNNTYLQFKKINENSIKLIKELFDVVISTKINKIKHFGETDGYTRYMLYDNLYSYFYDKYEKILSFSNCIINKNVDFIFDKYNKSVYSLDNNYSKSKAGLSQAIILIIPQKYYLKKMLYILENYNIIFNEKYIISSTFSIVLYYTFFPNWNNELFDYDIVNYNYLSIPYIKTNLKNKYLFDFYVDVYFIYSPAGYLSLKKGTKFNLNIFNFEKWDLIVKRILEENPKYEYIYNHIRTYRETLF